MIAQPLPQLDDFVAPRAGTRAGRNAARMRRSRTRRLRYRGIVRILVVLGALTLLVVFYLGLAANVMRLNYELGKVKQERAQLIDQTSRLDDQIARLESRERLAQVAARLGMREPATFAAVVLPAPGPRTPPPGLAFLNWPR
jgi:cell division protein FtsL